MYVWKGTTSMYKYVATYVHDYGVQGLVTCTALSICALLLAKVMYVCTQN